MPFHNEEHGFCVLRLEARGQGALVTVGDHATVIAAGLGIARNAKGTVGG